MPNICAIAWRGNLTTTMTSPELETGSANTLAPEQRLHSLSWLFVLLQQLKQFVVPLLILLVLGRRGGNDYGGGPLWPLIGVGVLAGV